MDILGVVVIGAGTVGREIAWLAVRAGYACVLEDVDSMSLETAIAGIEDRLDAAVARGEITIAESRAARARLTGLRGIEEAMRAGELIIDTTIDELETKLEIFTIYDKFARPGAILGCCTASLSVSDIATITFSPERCLAMRFDGAGERLKRVEIVRSARNGDEVIAACVEVARRMGLEVGVVSEAADSMRETED
jgi:3-hydroxybutyryl-CoA dehydrogenase